MWSKELFLLLCPCCSLSFQLIYSILLALCSKLFCSTSPSAHCWCCVPFSPVICTMLFPLLTALRVTMFTLRPALPGKPQHAMNSAFFHLCLEVSFASWPHSELLSSPHDMCLPRKRLPQFKRLAAPICPLAAGITGLFPCPVTLFSKNSGCTTPWSLPGHTVPFVSTPLFFVAVLVVSFPYAGRSTAAELFLALIKVVMACTRLAQSCSVHPQRSPAREMTWALAVGPECWGTQTREGLSL